MYSTTCSLSPLSSGDDTKSQFVCWYSPNTPVHTLHLHLVQTAGQYKEKQKQGIFTRAVLERSWRWRRPCFTRNAFEISSLHRFGYLTVQMHSPLHSITIQMCTDCCTAEGDCIVLAADAVLRSRWIARMLWTISMNLFRKTMPWLRWLYRYIKGNNNLFVRHLGTVQETWICNLKRTDFMSPSQLFFSV